MQITLTPNEMMIAGIVGLRRRIVAITGDLRERVELESTRGNEFDKDVIGAMAEMAVGRGLNLHWSVTSFGVDVGSVSEGVEVRCRRVGGSGLDLAFRKSDTSQRPYVLVHADVPVFTLVGWLYLREAAAAGTPGPGGLIYVPPNKLHDMVELIR